GPPLQTPTGTTSLPHNCNFYGFNLTGYPGNLTVTVTGGFEISLDPNSGYGSSLQVGYTSDQLPPTALHVRIPSTVPEGAVNGIITISGGGAPDRVVSISGNALASEPTSAASNITLSNVTDNGMDINWTNGNGASHLIVVWRTELTNFAFPTDGSNYNANTNVGSAEQYQPYVYAVYSGAGPGPITVSGLLPATNYG